jgi:EAL domain-containing protein (putative c-di-GMP-specific phosphodiesterase class I)/GGDEF domain-containing protein
MAEWDVTEVPSSSIVILSLKNFVLLASYFPYLADIGPVTYQRQRESIMSLTEPPVLEENFRRHPQDFGASCDTLTGLPDNAAFRHSLRSILLEAELNSEEIALVWIDILNLRREYSIGGDEGAEHLLLTVADSLRPWVDSGELICRFGDHSFLLALKRTIFMEGRLDLIVETASQHHLRGSEGKPEIAAGVSYFPSHARQPAELIRLASLAAVAASRTCSRSVVPYQPAMNAALQHERDLEKDLRDALKHGHLSLAYQPQIDLNTGEVVSVEALTRWNHPHRGNVSPSQFIAVAERSNLIHEIFRNALRQMLAEAASWRASGIHLPSISVNASPANIRRDDFVGIIEEELAANPLSGSRLDVEVTESLLMDNESLFIDRLEALREIGAHVSLDDFGTRYTSFNALKYLPLNTMKIDRCFVHRVDQSTQAQSLCRTIVIMARNLNLRTVAEGIEDIGELRNLKKLGCDIGQGFLFQRPVTGPKFLDFLKEWPARKKQPEFVSVFQSIEYNPRYDNDALFGMA